MVLMACGKTGLQVVVHLGISSNFDDSHTTIQGSAHLICARQAVGAFALLAVVVLGRFTLKTSSRSDRRVRVMCTCAEAITDSAPIFRIARSSEACTIGAIVT